MKESSTIRSDKDNVYLEIDNINECSFQIWEEVEEKKSRVSIRIPKKSWKSIIKHWDNQKKLNNNN